MKRIIALLAVFVLLSGSAFAANRTAFTLSAAGGGNVTTNISAVAGRSIVVTGIIANSDKAGSILTIKNGAAAGTTTNYTTIGAVAVGAATVIPLYEGFPIVFPVNTQAQFLLDSTTANNLLITYDYK